MNNTDRKPTGGRNVHRHRFDMPTAEWRVLPPEARPYRPAKFRPAEPAPDEAPTVPVPVNPDASDATRTHLWQAANVKPSPEPRPAVPPAQPHPVAAEPRDWRDRWEDLPVATRAAFIATLFAALIVVAVLLGVVR